MQMDGVWVALVTLPRDDTAPSAGQTRCAVVVRLSPEAEVVVAYAASHLKVVQSHLHVSFHEKDSAPAHILPLRITHAEACKSLLWECGLGCN